jgi:serine/threonine protein kinase
VQIRDSPRIELETIFIAASPALIHLIGSCLRLNPNNRCTATEALSSLYFQEEPYACDDSELPVGGNADQTAAKKRRLDGEITGRRLNFT